jgi:hypothetical protein
LEYANQRIFRDASMAFKPGNSAYSYYVGVNIAQLNGKERLLRKMLIDRRHSEGHILPL